MEYVGNYENDPFERLDFNAPLETAQNHDELLQNAVLLMESGGIDAALDIYRGLANLRDAPPNVLAIANFQLAISYHKGIGSRIDLGMAAQHYRLAALNGHEEAAVALTLLIIHNPYLGPYSLASYYGDSSSRQITNLDFDGHYSIQPVSWDDKQHSPYLAFEFPISSTPKPNTNDSISSYGQRTNSNHSFTLRQEPVNEHVALGDQAFKLGDYASCYGHYKTSGDKDKIKTITQWILSEAARLKHQHVKPAHDLYLILAKDDNIDAMLHLGSMCIHCASVKNYSTAELYLTKAYEKIKSTVNKTELARVTNLLGDLFSFQNKTEQALTNYEMAHTLGHNDAALKIAKIHMNPGFFEKERPSDVINWCTIAAVGKKNAQANHEFITWYEARPFWASTIEDQELLKLVADFYIRAGKKLPKELAAFQPRSINKEEI